MGRQGTQPHKVTVLLTLERKIKRPLSAQFKVGRRHEKFQPTLIFYPLKRVRVYNIIAYVLRNGLEQPP